MVSFKGLFDPNYTNTFSNFYPKWCHEKFWFYVLSV